MGTVFLNLLNMSIAASWVIHAVVLLRLLLKKGPKALLCVLWELVGIRLICPISFERVLSLIPSAKTVPPEILYTPAPTIQSGIPALNQTVNPVISQTLAPEVGASVNPMQVITILAPYVWVIGMASMLIYNGLQLLADTASG